MREHQAKLSLIASMTIFGTIGIMVHYIKVPTSLILIVRGFLGAFFLIFLSKMKKEEISKKVIKKNILALCISGVLIGLNWIFLFEAYKYTSVAIATLCCYFAPVFMMMFSPFVLKEKLSTFNIICIFVALLGMVFVSGIFENNQVGLNNLKGVILGLMSAVCYACVVFLNKLLKNISANDMTIVQLGMAGLAFLPYAIFVQKISNIRIDLLSLGLLLILGILHTGYSYAMYFNCIKYLKAQTIAIYSYIDPIVAIFLSALILKQKLSFYGIIGAVLILGSTFLSEMYSNKNNKK